MILYETIGHMIRTSVEAMASTLKRAVKKPISVTLPPEFIAMIEEQKARESRTASEIIREALRVYYRIGQPASATPMSGVRHRAAKV